MNALSSLLRTEGFPIRTKCTVCDKRRQCNLLAFFCGPAWTVCREHQDWLPVEGQDFEMEAAA